MKNSLHQHAQVATHLTLLALIIIVGVIISNAQLTEARKVLLESIKAKEAEMLSIAEITDRNVADEETKNIITDCARRLEFESLLVRLGSLSKPEMLSLQTMFESCSSFYPTQKAIMVAKLKQLLASYESDIKIYDTIADTGDITVNQAHFNQIIELEQQRSLLLKEQENIQSEIIALLISGKTTSSKEVTALIINAQDISDFLVVNNQQIDQIRSEIVI